MRWLSLSLLLSMPLTAHAVELAKPLRGAHHWGVGFGGGLGPSGISGKYMFTKATSLQAVIGAYGHYHPDWYSDAETLGVDVDFLFEMPAIASNDVVEVGWELGLGGWTGIGNDFWLGANGVAGIQFNFQPVPIDLTLEYKPGFLVVPDIYVEPVNFGGHLRIWFM